MNTHSSSSIALAIFLAALSFRTPHAQADVTEARVQRYDNVISNSNDLAFGIVRDSAGDIIVIGNSNNGITGEDMLTIKYSGVDGSVLWSRRFNGAGKTDDWAREVAVDRDGDILVTATSGLLRDSLQVGSYIAKYAAKTGTVVWEVYYTNGVASALVTDVSGNVIVSGYSRASEDSDAWFCYTAKYAATDGHLLWEKHGPRGRSQALILNAKEMSSSPGVLSGGFRRISTALNTQGPMELCIGRNRMPLRAFR